MLSSVHMVTSWKEKGSVMHMNCSVSWLLKFSGTLTVSGSDRRWGWAIRTEYYIFIIFLGYIWIHDILYIYFLNLLKSTSVAMELDDKLE